MIMMRDLIGTDSENGSFAEEKEVLYRVDSGKTPSEETGVLGTTQEGTKEYRIPFMKVES